MEQSSYVDATLRIYRALQERSGCAGFVLQSYLYRSESDLRAMLPSAPNVRIVKGAYLEPPSLAFPHKRDVDENLRQARELDAFARRLAHGHRDARCSDLARIEEFAAVRGLPKRGRFEFQTLYGIAEPLARGLVERGYRVRLSVPYGSFGFRI